MVKIRTVISLLVALAAAPSFAHAAVLEFTPPSILRTEGSTFTVTAMVSTPDEAINAVSGVISFPPDLLEVASISKADSIINLWVQEPSFSNVKGTVAFEGLVLNPGYQGNGGTVVAITFRTKAAGSAAVQFSSGSILANDGTGANILTDIESADVFVRPVSLPEGSSEAPLPVAGVQEALTNIVSGAIPEMPSVTRYPHEMSVDGTAMIEGIANPGVDIVIKLSHDGSIIQEQKSRVTGVGEFVVILGPISDAGNYSFTMQAIDEAMNESEISPPFAIVVKEKWLTTFINTVLKYLSITVLMALALAGVIIVSMFGWFRLSGIMRRMRRESQETQQAFERAFEVLRDGIARHIAQLKKAGRKPAKEEITFLNEFKKKLEKTGEMIAKEIKDISQS